jgi:hypothetical protein
MEGPKKAVSFGVVHVREYARAINMGVTPGVRGDDAWLLGLGDAVLLRNAAGEALSEGYNVFSGALQPLQLAGGLDAPSDAPAASRRRLGSRGSRSVSCSSLAEAVGAGAAPPPPPPPPPAALLPSASRPGEYFVGTVDAVQAALEASLAAAAGGGGGGGGGARAGAKRRRAASLEGGEPPAAPPPAPRRPPPQQMPGFQRRALLAREPVVPAADGAGLAAASAAAAQELAAMALAGGPFGTGCRCGSLTMEQLAVYSEDSLEAMCAMRGLPTAGAGRKGRRAAALAARVVEHAALQPPHCGGLGSGGGGGGPALGSGVRVSAPSEEEWSDAVERKDSRLLLMHKKAVAHAAALGAEAAEPPGFGAGSGGGGGPVCPCFAAGVGCTSETCTPCEANCGNGSHPTAVHLEPETSALHARLVKGALARARKAGGGLFLEEAEMVAWRARLAQAIMLGVGNECEGDHEAHGEEHSCFEGSSIDACGDVAMFLEAAPTDPEEFAELLESVEAEWEEAVAAKAQTSASKAAGAASADAAGEGPPRQRAAPGLSFHAEAAELLMAAMGGGEGEGGEEEEEKEGGGAELGAAEGDGGEGVA